MEIKNKIQLAQELINSNKLNKADSICKEILKQNPKSLPALLKTAQILSKRGQIKATLNSYKSILDLYPNNISARLAFANELQNQNKLVRAATLFKKILKKNPQHIKALIGLGFNATKQGQHQTALKFFQKVVSIQPGNIVAKINSAKELLILNKYEFSASMYESILKEKPRQINALRGIASIARKTAEHEKALSIFKQIHQYYPNNKDNHLDIAFELNNLGHLDEAEKIYQSILKNDPKHYLSLKESALISSKRGDKDKTLKLFNELQQLFPDKVEPEIELAKELRKQGKFTKCLEKLKQTKIQYPKHFGVHFQLGLIYRQLKQHQLAYNHFQIAHSLNLKHPRIQIMSASELFMLGQVDEAISSLKDLIQQDPQNYAALVQQGNWCLIARSYDQAIDFFQLAIKASPEQVQPYLQLIQTYLELGELDKCFQLFEEITKKIGNKAEIYHKKATILWQTRQINLALATQKEGLALFPDDYHLRLQNIAFNIDLGNYKEAIQSIELLPSKNFEQQLKVMLLSAQINMAKWQINDAIQQYDAILKLSPICFEAQRARLILALVSLDLDTARDLNSTISQHNIGIQKIKGQKRKYLHNHYAQFINEYSLNQEVLNQVQATLKLPLTKRFDKLATIIISEPESTSPAISFLAQLRLENYFKFQITDGKQAIPKKIFQYWDKSSPPKELLKFIESWQKHNPEYEHHLLDEIKARLFLQENYPKRVIKSYLQSAHVAQKADILRLALLLKHGGVYADADDLCLNSLDTLIPADAHLILWQELYASVGNNFIAVIPNHPVIKFAFEQAIEAMERGDKDSIWLSTGPGLLSRSLALYLAEHWPDRTPKDLKVNILVKAQIMNCIGIHGKLAYKSTEKSWANKEFEKPSTVKLNF